MDDLDRELAELVTSHAEAEVSLHEAAIRLIERTPGAECLGDVVRAITGG